MGRIEDMGFKDAGFPGKPGLDQRLDQRIAESVRTELLDGVAGVLQEDGHRIEALLEEMDFLPGLPELVQRCQEQVSASWEVYFRGMLGGKGGSKVPLDDALIERLVMDCWQEIGQRQGMGLIPVLAAHLYDRDVEVDVLREDFLALAQEAGRESAALEQVCAQVQDRLEQHLRYLHNEAWMQEVGLKPATPAQAEGLQDAISLYGLCLVALEDGLKVLEEAPGPGLMPGLRDPRLVQEMALLMANLASMMEAGDEVRQMLADNPRVAELLKKIEEAVGDDDSGGECGAPAAQARLERPHP